MVQPLLGRISLVTGASRGIGAATALKLASLGSDLILNYRSKAARAEEIAQQIKALGRKAIAIQADLTIVSELEAMMATIKHDFATLDVLILNASGGLEKDKSEDYAMDLNHTAQLNSAKLATQLMSPGGRIVFVTSHWAHFYGAKPVLPDYEAVARSKHAGEEALRRYASEASELGVSLIVVSGDVIEGTITPRLLERKNPGFMAQRSSDIKIPTVDEFAAAIAHAAADPNLPTGHTIFVGSTDF